MHRAFTQLRAALPFALGSLFVLGGHARAEFTLENLKPSTSGRPLALDRSLDELGASVQFASQRRMAADANPDDPRIRSVTHFTGSFTTAGQRYSYTMVGRRPEANDSVYVDNTIVPIRLVFPFVNAAGQQIVLDGGAKVANVIASPVYSKAADFGAGPTQFGDAMLRDTFWSRMRHDSRDNYHVLMATPNVHETIDILVPPDESYLFVVEATGAFLALLSADFLYSQLNTIFQLAGFRATELPVFIAYNTFLFNADPANCCILGFHSAFSKATRGRTDVVQTFLFANWSDSGIYSNENIADIHALSHEVAEWLNDPFINNLVPTFYNDEVGCSNLLETGDNLVGYSVPITLNGFTYHPQTEAMLPWFSREVPSRAREGAYSFPDPTALGQTTSPVCLE